MSKPVPISIPCPLCDAPLNRSSPGGGGGPHFDCPNCGRYGVSDFHVKDGGELTFDEDTKTKLKHLLLEHRLKGGQPPFLSTTSGGVAPAGKFAMSVTEFLERYPRSPLEYLDRALENLGRMITRPSKAIEVSGNASLPLALFCPEQERLNMLRQLVDLGWLNRFDNGAQQTASWVIAGAGWERIRQLQQPGRDARQAFVAMWFDPSQTEYFSKGFKPAIEEDGNLNALRIDGKDHNNKIDDEIVAEIRRSKFLVADFTGHRGGVYFEAGFALGLGLPVIWTCHETHIKDAHFDTRQYNHITYVSPEDLQSKLLNRIRATIN